MLILTVNFVSVTKNVVKTLFFHLLGFILGFITQSDLLKPLGLMSREQRQHKVMGLSEIACPYPWQYLKYI